MVFLASIFAWLLLIFMVAVILYIVFNYILGLFYSHEESIPQLSRQETSNKQEDSATKSRRRLIATFIITIMIILLASTGISTYMDTISHN